MKKPEKKNKGKGSVFKMSWKILLSIGIVLAIIASIFTFDGRYFKAEEAKKDKEGTIKTFEAIQKSLSIQYEQIQFDRKKDRLESQLRDLRLEQKLLIAREKELTRAVEKNPKQQIYKDNLSDIKRQIDENQKEIDEVKKQLANIK